MNTQNKSWHVLLLLMSVAVLALSVWGWLGEPLDDGFEETAEGEDAVQVEPATVAVDTPRTCLGDIEGTAFEACTVLAIP